MDSMDWPQKIKYLRLCHGYKTRKALAAKTGLTATTIYYLEKGYCRPRPYTITCLAQAFGMTEEELIRFAGDSEKQEARPPVVHDLGDLVRRIRYAKNLTQSQLAKLTGVTRTTINHIERGRVTPKRGTVRVLLEGVRRHFGDIAFIMRCS